MKAWEVIAVAVNGEYVCHDCMNEYETAVANDELSDDDITPFFASDIDGVETCGRCGEIIEGTEEE